MDIPLRRWLPVPLVLVALAGAGLAASGAGLTGGTLPPAPPELASPPEAQPGVGPQAPTATASPGPPLAEVDYPDWLGTAVTGLFLGIVAAVAGLSLYAGLRWLLTERVTRWQLVDRRASQPAGAATDEAQVRDAVRAGLADLDAGGDARRAVIACWLRLERIAGAAGTARLAADTPTDLVARLLAAHRVSDRALRRLADAYRQARYAPAEVGDELAATARQALRDVDAQLLAASAGVEPR